MFLCRIFLFYIGLFSLFLLITKLKNCNFLTSQKVFPLLVRCYLLMATFQTFVSSFRFTSVYPCSHCNSLFRLQSDLETHLRTAHSKPQLVTLLQDNLSYSGPSSFCSSSSSSGCSSVASTSSNFSSLLPDHPMLIKQVNTTDMFFIPILVTL